MGRNRYLPGQSGGRQGKDWRRSGPAAPLPITRMPRALELFADAARTGAVVKHGDLRGRFAHGLVLCSAGGSGRDRGRGGVQESLGARPRRAGGQHAARVGHRTAARRAPPARDRALARAGVIGARLTIEGFRRLGHRERIDVLHRYPQKGGSSQRACSIPSLTINDLARTPHRPQPLVLLFIPSSNDKHPPQQR